MAASAVRRVLGEPADVLHHTLFGINVDQWVYSRAGPVLAIFIVVCVLARQSVTISFNLGCGPRPAAAEDDPVGVDAALVNKRQVHGACKRR